MPISSPCIKRCVIGGNPGSCLGCGRTLDEIARWSALPEADRLAIMVQLPTRLQAANPSLVVPSRERDDGAQSSSPSPPVTPPGAPLRSHHGRAS